MNIYAWIGIVIIGIATVLPLLKKENRSRWKIFQAVWTLFVLSLTVIAIKVMNINLFTAIIIATIAIFLSERSVYTKKGLIALLVIIIFLGGTSYYIFRDDLEYVESFLEGNPETTSLYVTRNGEDVIKYQVEQQRPLASVVKIVIAVEYAYQVAEGKINKEEKISLLELDKFYLEGTDGDAHPSWLRYIETEGFIEDESVSLHQVAKGMITYSSNANTEYLMDLLGLENINKRIQNLELKKHGSIYPLSSALLISEYTNNKSSEKIYEMSDEEYQRSALDIHRQLKLGNNSLKEEAGNLPLKLQKVWSNRLTRATASDYQKLMFIINQGDVFSADIQTTIRSLMEWPMELHESNRKKYHHFGAKGGSTAYILNQAMYIEDKSNNKMELILFTNKLSLLESIKLNQNIDGFLLKLSNNQTYLQDVKEKLIYN